MNLSGELAQRPIAPEVFEEAKTVIRPSPVAEPKPAHVPANVPGNRRVTPASVAKVLVGQRLNHFRIDALIGGGGMGAVFRSHDEQLDRHVAIKVIPFVADDPDLQRRFRNESQSAAKLDHPQIAKVFDAGSHGEWHYIVFEYVRGTNIRDWVHQRGVMSIDDAVFYTSQLADALQHAADRGIVHRDVKPSNVLISDEGGIKLVDMGLARSAHLDLAEDLTASGVTLGTFDYISPEQAQDPRNADLRSDIYSLGCTIYFMLTGQPPYPGGTMLQKLLKHENSPPPDARELRGDISADLTAVLTKMLAKSPIHRYQNSQDLIADLHEVASREKLRRTLSLGPSTIEGPSPLRLTLGRHFPWIASVVVMVLIAGWLRLESAARDNDIPIPTSGSDLIRHAADTQPALPASIDDGLAGQPGDERSLSAATSEAAAVSDDFDDRPTRFPVPDPLIDSTPDLDPTSPQAFERAARSRSPDLQSVPDPVQIGVRLVRDGERLIEKLLGGVGQEFAPRSIEVVSGTDNGTLLGLSDGRLVTDSLPQAIQLANDFGLGQITLASEHIVSPPIEIEASKLLIRSKLAGSVVEFVSPEVIELQRPVMVRLGSSSVTFEKIHFVWRVPQEVDGGALFEVSPRSRTRLVSSTITVHNRYLRDGIHAFDVVPATDRWRVPGDDFVSATESSDEGATVDLDLTHAVVRGEMTMISMQEALRLRINWDNGLLAVSEWMIDTGGSRQPEAIDSDLDWLRLSFSRVTARAALGLYRVVVRTDDAHAVTAFRDARHCVFASDPNRASFEVINYPSQNLADGFEDRSLDFAPGISSPLRMEGNSNAYTIESPLQASLLRLVLDDGQVKRMPFEQLNDPLNRWVDESDVRWSVPWKLGVMPGGAMSDHLPADYRQKGDSNPGFDEKMLPHIPTAAN